MTFALTIPIAYRTGGGSAVESLLQTGRPPADWEDPWIDFALEAFRAAVDQGRKEPPNLGAARAIYEADGPVRHEIEARLLAAETPAVIAAKLRSSDVPMTPIVIEIFEIFFFNVAYCLQARDWLMTQVIGIGPGMQRAITERDAWCYWALAGGTAMVDLLTNQRFLRPIPVERESAASR